MYGKVSYKNDCPSWTVQQRISSSGERSLVREELFYLTYYLNPVNLRFAKFELLSGVSNDLYLSPWLLAW